MLEAKVGLEPGNTKGGSVIVPLTSCLTGLESAVTTDNFCLYLQNRLIQTSQTGGQWYSDTSPFSIPWPNLSGKARPETIISHIESCLHYFQKD